MVTNALSIDLEDWYQGLTSTSRQQDRWPSYEKRVEGCTEQVLSILDEAGVKATFFVLGYVAEEFPKLVRKVADAGHEIGLHSYRHRRVWELTPETFREDVQRGRSVVEQASGRAVIGYRAPMFSVGRSTLWALEILDDLGFQYDSSIFPVRNLWYGFSEAPRFPYRPFPDRRLIEVPLSTSRIAGVNWPVAGGFYLRLLPYPVIKGALKRINRETKPAVMYMHPWELDTGQLYRAVTPRERVTHYHGRRKLRVKLRRLLSDFQFAPIQAVLAGITVLSEQLLTADQLKEPAS